MGRTADKTIWKVELSITDEITVRLPAGWHALCVQMQGGHPCLWAVVNPSRSLEDVPIRCYGTGHPMHEDCDPAAYIDTIQMGPLVFHFFVAY